jgi:hypothetical protein
MIIMSAFVLVKQQMAITLNSYIKKEENSKNILQSFFLTYIYYVDMFGMIQKGR